MGGAGEPELLEAALQQVYQEQDAPPEVLVAVDLPDPAWLQDWLSDRAGRQVRLVAPRRGDKRALVDLVARNAALAYDTRFNAAGTPHYDALDTLRAVLGLPAVPRRVECFDISTIQGSETVASMVVCEGGRMRRGEYRKFRIRTALGRRADGSVAPDDFAAMYEVVGRRYRRALEEGRALPDLVLIDGGKGQLSMAYAALRELGLDQVVAVALAKKEELVFTRDREEPVVLPASSPALLLLQRIRDEAHRFAVTFHRRSRAMRDLRSELDAVPGIGPRRRKALLTRFGSVAGVRRATREDLVGAVGARAADAILTYFSAIRGQ
jgi:excinuclease ABC subunit C